MLRLPSQASPESRLKETRNNSCQKDDVRPRSRRQSKACQDCRQGIPSCCVEGPDLILDSTRPVFRIRLWEDPQRDSTFVTCWLGGGLATTAIVRSPKPPNLRPACTKKIMPFCLCNCLLLPALAVVITKAVAATCTSGTCMHACMHACIHTYIYIHTYIHAYIHSYIRSCMRA